MTSFRKSPAALAIAVFVLGGTLLPIATHAAQVTFLWDYQDPRAAGFNLYCGPTSGFYNIRMDVGNTTNATVSGFTAGDTYHCTVTAYDSAQESPLSNEITVMPQAAPSPNFSMSKTSGKAPLSVAFTDTTSGQANQWQWDFGDGSSSTSQHPTHVYGTPGRYTVVLTAIGPGGSVSKTAATSIAVDGTNAIIGAVRAAVAAKVEVPPVTNFAIGATVGNAPFSVKFTNATTYASGWKWDFGDGAASTEHSPTHTYYLPGTYTVKLTAAGPGGSVSKTASTPITVGAAPGVPVGTSCSSGSPSVALFGDQTLGTDDVSPLGVARAFSTTASGCGKVGALNVYLESNSTATRLILGLYSDAAGHPGLLLAQGSTSNPIAGALNTIPVFPTRVDTGEVYWIAILGTQTGDVHFQTKAGSCTAETSIEANLTTLPSSWTTGTIEAACQLSAYGTSTP